MTMRFWLLLVGALLCATPGFAQDEAAKAQARAQFNRGIEQYAASQYDEALESFQEAYRLSPHPLVRVNMANCYDRLGKPVEALFHFERFIRETAGDSARAAQRAEVESAIRRLKHSVGELTVRVIPDGARVRIDETEEQHSPISEPIVLAAGDHVVKVEHEGFVTTERHLRIHGGVPETLNISLDREEVAAVIAPTPPPSQEPPAETTMVAPSSIQPLGDYEDLGRNNDEDRAEVDAPPEVTPIPTFASEPQDDTVFTPPVIISAVVSGSLLVCSAIAGIAALSANADFKDYEAQAQNPALPMMQRESARIAALSAADRADGRALTADLFLAGSLIAGAATLYFVLTQDHAEDEEGGQYVALRLGPTGASIRGAF